MHLKFKFFLVPLFTGWIAPQCVFAPEKRADGALLVRVVYGPLGLKGVNDPAKPEVVKIFRAEQILVGGLPNVGEVQFIWVVVAVETDVVLGLFVDVEDWIVK